VAIGEYTTMKLLFNILIPILFVTGGCLLFFIIVKTFLMYKKFRNYLLSINDEETLSKIKKLNPMGQRKFPSSPFMVFEIHIELLKKYKNTKDDHYLLFDKKYMLYFRLAIIIATLLFLFFVFYQIISYE
jgi:hypothetical protein